MLQKNITKYRSCPNSRSSRRYWRSKSHCLRRTSEKWNDASGSTGTARNAKSNAIASAGQIPTLLSLSRKTIIQPMQQRKNPITHRIRIGLERIAQQKDDEVFVHDMCHHGTETVYRPLMENKVYFGLQIRHERFDGPDAVSVVRRERGEHHLRAFCGQKLVREQGLVPLE